MSRPLLITDCDEVLLHMVVPFAEWLDETRDIHFDLDTGSFMNALRHKRDGTLVSGEHIAPLLNGFFTTEMHRQQAIEGAVESILALAEHGDVVILTNLTDNFRDARAEQLRAVGIDFPVYTNQGGKGGPLARIVAEHKPTLTVFIDDLGHHHESVEEHAPDVFRLHFIGEPLLAKRVKPAHHAHARLDDWHSARGWIMNRFEGVPL